MNREPVEVEWVAERPAAAPYRSALLLGLAALLVVGGLLHFVPRSWPVLRVLVLVWLGFIVLVVLGVGQTRRLREGERGWVAFLAAQALVIAGCSFLLAHFLAFERVRVFVDNASPQDVRIELDGDTWTAMPRGAQIETTIRAGVHRVEFRGADGALLDRLTIEAEAGEHGPYVLNVLGRQKYAFETARYSVSRFGSSAGPTRRETQAVWFEAKDVDFLFSEFPESVRARASGTSMTRLARVP